MFSAGISVRYYSFMQNIDKTFYDIDKSGTLPSGITQYRAVSQPLATGFRMHASVYVCQAL